MGSMIRNLILASFVTPPFLGAIAWIFLAGPREGWLNDIGIDNASDAKQDAAEEGLDDAAFDLDVSGIPDIADYANALRTGLTIDQLRPTRRIAKVVMGRRIVWEAGESTEALADVLSDTAAPLTTRGRLAAPDVLAALEDADAAA